MAASAKRGPGRPPGRQGEDLLALARATFLEFGFDGTTMQEVARRARVSKSSLYREHCSKDALFVAVVEDWVERGQGAMRPHVDSLLTATHPTGALVELAEVLLEAVLALPVAQMRRLVAAEAERFPEVASAYLHASWEANTDVLGVALATLGHRGQLRVDHPHIAAQQFVWLVVGGPLNIQTLTGNDKTPDAAARRDIAVQAVSTFLARYGV